MISAVSTSLLDWECLLRAGSTAWPKRTPASWCLTKRGLFQRLAFISLCLLHRFLVWVSALLFSRASGTQGAFSHLSVKTAQECCPTLRGTLASHRARGPQVSDLGGLEAHRFILLSCKNQTDWVSCTSSVSSQRRAHLLPTFPQRS